MADERILAINTGSSSLKAGLFGPDVRRLAELKFERIGRAGGHVRMVDANGATTLDEAADLPGHDAAIEQLLRIAGQRGSPAAVGHRVVHGGSRYSSSQRVTPALVEELRTLVPLAPLHLPQAIDAIEAVARTSPALLQIACFDTAFHRTLPRVAQIEGLPRHLLDDGILRYGFHGISYEYIVSELRRIDPEGAERRVIVAHLGNGASMAAIRSGRSVETTMGFTPTGGLVMGTRSGDLDPGILLFLLEQRGMDVAGLNAVVNERGGLLGVSGTSGDMRDLLDRRASDPRAAEAVSLFCYTARKLIGALAAALGGVDTLVFTAGIGERAAAVREEICQDLSFLGVALDPDRNQANAPVISPDGAAVTVRVIPTDEELMIARHTRALLGLG